MLHRCCASAHWASACWRCVALAAVATRLGNPSHLGKERLTLTSKVKMRSPLCGTRTGKPQGHKGRGPAARTSPPARRNASTPPAPTAARALVALTRRAPPHLRRPLLGGQAQRAARRCRWRLTGSQARARSKQVPARAALKQAPASSLRNQYSRKRASFGHNKTPALSPLAWACLGRALFWCRMARPRRSHQP